MKAIILGDPHANLAALEAAVTLARETGYDQIYHTGGLVGIGDESEETVSRVMALRISGVRGETDEEQASEGSGLSFVTRHRLADLPFSLSLEAQGQRVLIVHGSPTDLYEPLDDRTPISRFLEVIE